MKVFAISGKAQHGKDTFGKMLCEKLREKGASVLVVHYGDYLKLVAKEYFEWSGNKDEEGRTLLQIVGTDIIRNTDENFWVNIVEELLTVLEGQFSFAIIPDTRYPNEIEFLKMFKHDVTSIRINRTNYISPLTEEQQNHISETALDNFEFDWVFNCESGVENIQKVVDSFFEDFDGQDY